MSKVITFSRTFPAYHPKAGQPTYFVEKILNSIIKNNFYFLECDKCGFMFSSQIAEGGGQIADTGDYDDLQCPKCYTTKLSDIDLIEDYYIGKYTPKHHTIRSGNRWKVGDKFSPRVWSGNPYRSKQITIAQDIEVKKVWEFNKYESSKYFFINNRKLTFDSLVEKLAENDGLESHDLLSWFKYPKPFSGQIICWNENINY